MAEAMDSRGTSSNGAASRVDGTGAARPLAARAPLASKRPTSTLEEVTDLALVTIALPPSARVEATLERAFDVTLPGPGDSVVTPRGERLMALQPDRLFVLFAADTGDVADALGTGDVAETGAAAAATAAANGDPERALLAHLEAADDEHAQRRRGDGRTIDESAEVIESEPSDGAARKADDDGRTDASLEATGTNGSRDTAAGATGTNGRTLFYCSDQSDAWAMLRLGGRGSRTVLERLCPLDLHRDAFAVGAVARSVVEHLGVIVLREGEDDFLLLSPRSSARAFLHEIETTIRHIDDASGESPART